MNIKTQESIIIESTPFTNEFIKRMEQIEFTIKIHKNNFMFFNINFKNKEINSSDWITGPASLAASKRLILDPKEILENFNSIIINQDFKLLKQLEEEKWIEKHQSLK